MARFSLNSFPSSSGTRLLAGPSTSPNIGAAPARNPGQGRRCATGRDTIGGTISVACSRLLPDERKGSFGSDPDRSCRSNCRNPAGIRKLRRAERHFAWSAAGSGRRPYDPAGTVLSGRAKEPRLRSDHKPDAIDHERAPGAVAAFISVLISRIDRSHRDRASSRFHTAWAHSLCSSLHPLP